MSDTAVSTGSGLIAVTQEAGVHDLPLGVRRWFAKALLAERDGEGADVVAKYLDNAIEAERTGKSQ